MRRRAARGQFLLVGVVVAVLVLVGVVGVAGVAGVVASPSAAFHFRVVAVVVVLVVRFATCVVRVDCISNDAS